MEKEKETAAVTTAATATAATDEKPGVTKLEMPEGIITIDKSIPGEVHVTSTDTSGDAEFQKYAEAIKKVNDVMPSGTVLIEFKTENGEILPTGNLIAKNVLDPCFAKLLMTIDIGFMTVKKLTEIEMEMRAKKDKENKTALLN